MKYGSFITLLFLISCEPATVEELRNEEPILTGILQPGTDPSLKLFTLEDEVMNISDGNITIQSETGEAALIYQDGEYVSADYEIEPGVTYAISGNVDGREFSASCLVPPVIGPTSAVNTNIIIQPNLPGTAFFMTWTNLDPEKYTYLLDLEVLEENPVLIPFGVPSGNFESQFSLPVVSPGVLLYDTDFRYYGNHRLTVYAIDREFEDVFFYGASDIRGLLTNGPDNINGIKGFLTAVSSFSIDLVIE